MNYIDKTVDCLLSFFFTSEKVLVTDDLFFTGYSFSCMFIMTAYIFREIYEYRKLKY